MSVTINWRPAAKNERHFDGGTSSDLDAVEKHECIEVWGSY